jgi:cyanate permease
VRRAVACGFGLGLSSGFNPTGLGGIAAETADAYGVPLAVVGVFTAALLTTHVLMQVPAGRLSDRIGAARAGTLGLLVVCAGAASALLAPEPALAIASRLVMGVGTATVWIAGSALVREAGGSAFAQGLYGGVAMGTGGIAIAAVPALEGPLGWRAPYWGAIAVALAGLAPLLASGLLRRSGARVPAGTPREGILGDRRLYPIALLFAASYGVSVPIANWTVELLERHGRMSDGVAALIGGSTLILAIVSRPLGGWILRHRPALMRRAVALSLGAGAAGTLALTAADPPWLAAAGGILLGIGAGVPFAAVFGGAALSRLDAPAAATGFTSTVANVVVLFGTPLMGLTFSLPGAGRLGFLLAAPLWLSALPWLPRGRELGVEPIASR